MEKWYSRYRRGDVWFLKFDTEDGDGTHGSSVEKKSRPYLIVSCEENNMCAPTINVIPITTRNKDHLPMHVFFVYQDGTPSGRNQMVLCEQITTVSVIDFNRKGSFFMYSFNLDFMNQVDEALTRQLGLKPRVADMKVIERMIDELAAQKERELIAEKEKEVQARVEVIAEELAKRFQVNLKAEVTQNNTQYRDEELQLADKETVQEMRDTAKERATVAKPQLSDTSTATEPTVPNPKKEKNRWTLAKMQEFVDDYAKMTISQVSEKWGLTKKSIQQMNWKFKKELENDCH